MRLDERNCFYTDPRCVTDPLPPDLPIGMRVNDVMILPDAKFLARYDQRFLGGVVVLEAALRAKPGGAWGERLDREFRPQELKPVKTKPFPYFVRANRGVSEMSVWRSLK